MALFLYNTLGRKLQEFRPLSEGKVGMYACGPTVYNYAHIGNLRMYISEDTLRRTLEFLGYRVNHVMNITDVGHLTDDADGGEDKMVKSSRETGMTVWDIAKHYTDAFFSDLERLNILPPTVSCRATDHIPEMIALIRRLEERGYTYFSGGNVYFDISKFPTYGELACLDLESLRVGARIDVDVNKRNPYDFVLWFTRSKFEHQAMLWDSPWGTGYPGWHVECSAMSMKYLGEQFDIHCGGIDHIPIHHTNEIAQSEAATGKRWVNFWIHGEFLLMDKGKMAKSAGGFLTLSSLIEKGYDPLDYRYFCLGGHYRSQLQFSFDSLNGAKAARAGLVERLRELSSSSADGSIVDLHALERMRSFTEALQQDVNMPKALSELWGLVKDKSISAGQRLAAVFAMDRVLGLDLQRLAGEKDIPLEGDSEVVKLVREREEARKRKDFARADEIRETLDRMGISIKDTPEGTRWKRLS